MEPCRLLAAGSGLWTRLRVAYRSFFHARPTWRRPSQGFSLFGWCNLAFVIRGGFGPSTITDAERIVEGSRMGVAFGVIAALLAAGCLNRRIVEPTPPPWDATSLEGTDSPVHWRPASEFPNRGRSSETGPNR